VRHSHSKNNCQQPHLLALATSHGVCTTTRSCGHRTALLMLAQMGQSNTTEDHHANNQPTASAEHHLQW